MTIYTLCSTSQKRSTGRNNKSEPSHIIYIYIYDPPCDVKGFCQHSSPRDCRGLKMNTTFLPSIHNVVWEEPGALVHAGVRALYITCPFKYKRIRNDPDIPPTPTHTCEHCGKVFMLESFLNMHMAKHDERTHACLYK
jgi:hypothetical protein